jgi:hypothetical protein
MRRTDRRTANHKESHSAMTTSKRRTRYVQAPIHAAIVALRAVVEAFIATRGVASTMHSDLRHDERAIKEHPDQAFAWILHPYATHMQRIDLTAVHTDLATNAKPWPVMVSECYSAQELASNVEFHFWDGSALIKCRTAEELHERSHRYRAAIVVAKLNAELIPIREELAYAGPGEGVWRASLARSIAEREQHISELTERYL